MPAMLATREDIDATLHDQRPPCKPLDLPQCYARDLKVPRTHEGGHAVRARTPVEGFSRREFYGLLEAGTFRPIYMAATSGQLHQRNVGKLAMH